MDYVDDQQPQRLITAEATTHFTPSKSKFLGMALFFVIPVGFPISFYTASSIVGYFFPTPTLLGLTALFMSILIPCILLYLYFTNCSIILEDNQITFRRIFPPYLNIATIDFGSIKSITVTGIGGEQEVSSDKKWITIEHNGKATSYRCDGYINDSEELHNEQPIVPAENFTLIRSKLKDLCQANNIAYSEQ